LYAVVQALRHWRHYLLPQEFVLYSDHEALRYLNSQKKSKDIFLELQSGQSNTADGFRLEAGYLFKTNKLCIPRTSVWDFIVWEIHARGLAGHFGRDKTIEEVERQFYWPRLKKDVAKIVSICNTCQLAKQKRQNTGLYTPYLFPVVPGKTSVWILC
jgi:hypothetical protein